MIKPFWYGNNFWEEGIKSCNIVVADSCSSPGEQILAVASIADSCMSVVLLCSKS
jgi:hypothetical protein